MEVKNIFIKTISSFLIVAIILNCFSLIISESYAVSSTDDEAILVVDQYHEGGEESSGIFSGDLEENKNLYDTGKYIYKIGDTTIYKIIEKGDEEYKNEFYCIDAENEFPGINSEGITYVNKKDFEDAENSDVKKLIFNGEDYNQENWQKNYNSLKYLFNNLYLEKVDTSYKEEYLEKMFKDALENDAEFYDEIGDMDTIKILLTDDDIDVVQQYAIWYFTNGDNPKYNTEIENEKLYLPAITRENSEIDTVYENKRRVIMNKLYNELVSKAKEYDESAQREKEFPKIVKTEAKAEYKDEKYIYGPYKITSGNKDDYRNYEVKLKDIAGNEIDESKYELYVGEEKTTKKLNELFDQEFYIHLSKDIDTDGITLNIQYKYDDRKVTLWISKDNEERYQKIVLIENSVSTGTETVSTYLDKYADLSLRKFISAVSEDERIDEEDYLKESREPEVDYEKLDSGESSTAIYNQSKTPLYLNPNDYVLYTIRVYNEGNIDVYPSKVKDVLPEGLEIVKGNEINNIWDFDETTRCCTTNENYEPKLISAHEKGKELSYVDLKMLCKISENVEGSTCLLNLAEISEIKDENNEEIEDRDSEENNSVYPDNPSEYNGGEDKDKTDNYIPGQEDDDDFDKIIINKKEKIYDLSLRKFICAVSEDSTFEKNEYINREPVVDISKLDSGEKTTAVYKQSKEIVEVKEGNYILYTIRIYNEGNQNLKVKKVIDYLPEGLEFDQNNEINKIWEYNSEKRSLTTKDDYVSDVIELHEKGENLKYKDIQVVLKVKDGATKEKNITNIAEIVEILDENNEEVKDRDSEGNNLNYPENPSDYNGGEDDDKTDNYIPGQEDDDDFDKVIIREEKIYDLSLKKFISGLSKDAVFSADEKITKYEPKVDIKELDNGKTTATYTISKEALEVKENDYILYTIRVYNEGNQNTKVAEIVDYLPEGLDFVKIESNNIWNYDSNTRKITTNSNFVPITLKAHEKGKALSYADIYVVCKVNSNVSNNKNIVNIAEITKMTDENNKIVKDRDSAVNNYDSKKGYNQEDDDDYSQIIVKKETTPVQPETKVVTKTEYVPKVVEKVKYVETKPETQVVEKVVEKKVEVPATGDNVPKIIISIIVITILANVWQVTINKIRE